jgi:hypothetical protein
MSVRKRKLYKRNSGYVLVRNLVDKSNTPNTPVTDGVGTGTLYDGAGVAVTGMTNVSSTYDAPSLEYRFDVNPATFDPVEAKDYVFKGVITSGTKRFDISLPVEVALRKEGTEA